LSHQRLAARVGASRTLVTLGPAARSQVLRAGLLVGELELKPAERLGEGRVRHPPTLQTGGYLKQPDKQEGTRKKPPALAADANGDCMAFGH
jgi:hypothetical protein